MKRLLKYILFSISILPAVMISGCKGDEEALKPSEPVTNPFAVPDDATGFDAGLRRKFFNDHGCYLLFTTELNGSAGGTLAGNELEDLRWNLTSFDDNDWVIEFFETDEEKQQAYDIIENIFLPHMDPAKLPYSMMPLKEYYEIWSSGRRGDDIAFKSVFRCTAYNIGSFIGLSPEEQEKAFRDMVYNIVNKTYSSYSDEMEDFLAVSEEYYDFYCSETFSDWEYMDDDERTEAVRSIGFTRYYPDSYGEWEYDEFPYRATDLRAFYRLVLDNTPEEFYEQWDGYDIIIQKYDIMRRIIAEEIGFIF